MFRQLLMNPLDLLRLLGTILGEGVLLRLKIQKEQEQFLNLQWQIQAAPRRTCSIQGGKDPLQVRAGGEDDGLSAAKDALNLLPFPSHLLQDGGFIVRKRGKADGNRNALGVAQREHHRGIRTTGGAMHR